MAPFGDRLGGHSFLVNLSGFGDGFDDSKWEELDANRGKVKLARFKDKAFIHWDALSAVIGDTITTGENVSLVSILIDVEPPSPPPPLLDPYYPQAGSGQPCDLPVAERRAKALSQLKKNRKRRWDDSADAGKNARLKAMIDMSTSLQQIE
ncbi:Aste57867_9672 [Aphanomyces stellatus]|uniref:Aste57867_9672 protein n=1 Tax=Aphanomyces stellatus TaxID=120398 RepID=A0A485KNZ9_9STRA|nr:hypothetical protein As57867_009634 [Aphanomyces stellatus]VFT86551.1 Aste57867_9672 [Aphanomyces stellatus]